MAVSAKAIEAGEAAVRMSADDSKLKAVLDKNIERMKRFGATIRNIGVGTAGLGAAILAPLAANAFKAFDYLDKINKLADRTDSTTEAVSRLGYAAAQSDASLEDIAATNKKLTMSAVAATKGSEDQAAAFAKMGVTAEQFLSMPIDERILAISEAYDSLENPLDQATFLTSLLGKQSASLLPLLKSGADGIRDLYREAEQTGSIINTEDAKKSTEALDAMDAVMSSLKSVLIETALAIFSLGGDLKEGQRIILMYVKMVRNWVKENKKLIAIVGIVGAALVAIGGTLVIVGASIGAIAAGISGLIALGTAVGAILALITVKGIVVAAVIATIVVAIGAAVYAFFRFTKTGQRMVEIMSKGFQEIGRNFSAMWEGILAALQKGDLETVGQIITMGLYANWLSLTMSMKESWYEFINFFTKGFIDGVSLIRAYFTKVVSYLKTAGLSAIKFIADKMRDIFSVFDSLGIEELKELQKSIKLTSDLAAQQIKVEEMRQIKVEAGIFAEGDEFFKAIKDGQQATLDQDKENYVRYRKLLEELVKKAKEPIKVDEALPVAPMPHEPGKRLDANLALLGDSVRGLFSSADFQGSLGLGEANRFAKESRDLQKNMLGELKEINRKVAFAEFG